MNTVPNRPWFVVGPWLLALTLLHALPGMFPFAAHAAEQGEKKAKVFALLHVTPQPPRLLDGGKAKVDREEFLLFLHTQAAMLKTRPVLNAALKSPKVQKLQVVKQQKSPLLWLEEQVQVEADKKTGLIRVAVPAGTPEEQAGLTNAVVEAYLNEMVNKDHTARLTRLDSLKKLYAEYDSQLREKRRILRVLSDDLGSRDAKLLALKQELAFKQLGAMHAELLSVESQIRKAKLELAVTKVQEKEKLPDSPVSDKELEEALAKNQVVALLLGEIAHLETTATTLKRLLANPEKESAYQKVLQRLDGARKDLSNVREKMRPVVAKQLRERLRIDLEANRKAAEERLTLLGVVEKMLSTAVKDHTEKMLIFNKKSEDLEWLRDEIAHVGETARKIGQQVQLLQVEVQALPRVRMIQDAQAPGK